MWKSGRGIGLSGGLACANLPEIAGGGYSAVMLTSSMA